MHHPLPGTSDAYLYQLQVMSFVKPTKQEFASHPLFQFVQINLQDSVLKSFLVSLFASGIRKTLPEPLWPTYMISSQNMECVPHPMPTLF